MTDKRKKSENELIEIIINNYVMLDYLPQLTEFTHDSINTYTAIYNQLPHEPTYFQAPDYIPKSNVTNRGNGKFSLETNYHVNIASLLLLGEWFNLLKENDVYDNSRIIIVSDHGADISSPFPNNITLPNGRSVETYNPLLLYKDFNADNTLITDNTFMTNADTLFLVFDGIIHNPVNPFTGSVLRRQKENGVTITTAGAWMPKYKLDAGKNDWLHVKDNIFVPSNWSLGFPQD